MVFRHFTCILHVYLPYLKLSNQHFNHELWYFNPLDPCLYHRSSVDRAFLSWVSSFRTYVVCRYSCCSCLRYKRILLANFHAKWSLILVSFYKLSLYRTPHPYGVSLGSGLTPPKYTWLLSYLVHSSSLRICERASALVVGYLFLRPCGIIRERITLFSFELRRVFLGIGLSLFWIWGTKFTEKEHPVWA